MDDIEFEDVVNRTRLLTQENFNSEDRLCLAAMFGLRHHVRTYTIMLVVRSMEGHVSPELVKIRDEVEYEFINDVKMRIVDSQFDEIASLGNY